MLLLIQNLQSDPTKL